ncbi:hypothetical protein [Acetobacter sp. AAB5]|uniref:hypothetical protein n=1 Tax=Acetobacter sp. AAB5 TaxID=3418370 RepID=UPI003CF9C92E
MRQITKLLMALPVITGLGLASVPMAQAQPGPHMMGGPGWGGGPRGGPGGPGWGGPRGGYYHHRGPGGGAIAGALIGGLAVGALAGATIAGGPPVAYGPPLPPPPPPTAYVVPAVPVMPGPGYGYYGPRGYYQAW